MITAWQHKLLVSRTQRHSWFNMPDISRLGTCRALTHFEAAPRKALLKELAGGYQLETQKQKWATDATGTCRFCPDQDSRTHRMLSCPAGIEARAPFEAVCQWIEDSGSILAEFPFCTVHPFQDLLRTMFFQLTLEPPDHTLIQHIGLCAQHQVQVNWSTDGACQLPHLQEVQHSAFAIILDTCQTDSDRIAWVSDKSLGTTCPGGWKPVFAARTPGEQDILRAELTALVWIIVNFGYGTIFSDSQAAIDLIHKVMHATSTRDFHLCEHFDLLLRVWEVRSHNTCTLQKIKGHQDPLQQHDLLHRYFIYGNILADETAGKVLQQHLPHLQKLLNEVMESVHDDAINTPEFFRMSLALQNAYKQAHAGLDTQPVGAQASDDIFQAFANWEPHDPYTFIPQLTLDHLHGSIYGDKVSVDTLRWLSSLQWTDDPIGPMEQPTGISWLELAMSWIHTTGYFLPVVRECQQEQRIVLVGSDETALALGLTWLEQGTALQKVLDHIISLIPEPIMPVVERKKVPSLYIQGCDRNTVGWVTRPQIPGQLEIAERVKALFNGGDWTQQHVCPQMQFLGDDIFLPGSMKTRLQAARKAQIPVRALRRM